MPITNTTYIKLWDEINSLRPMAVPGADLMVTAYKIRKQVVSTAELFLGCKEGDERHKTIIDTYNGRKPLPRGYAVTYTDAWCATYNSSIDIMCGIADYTPIECSCLQQINIAKKLGIWVEDDAYVPKVGDRVMYAWQNSGTGDNKNAPNHTGIIEKCENGYITVIEGNYKDGCNRRTIRVNDPRIRGFICPNYNAIAIAIRGKLIVADFVDVPRGVYFEKELEWAKEKDVVYGIDKTHFGPAMSTDRAQMVTLLYRLYGKNEIVNVDLPFTDIDKNGYYINALKWGYKYNIVEGVTETTFAPNAACKRAEVVAMMYRMKGSPEPIMNYSPFDDINTEVWYNDAVTWAYENNIVKGVGGHYFAPEDDLLRRDTVCVLYRIYHM